MIWINAGFLHIPVNEDIPQTRSKNSLIGFMLKPENFFSQSPDSLETSGYVFTANVSIFMPNNLSSTLSLLLIGKFSFCNGFKAYSTVSN